MYGYACDRCNVVVIRRQQDNCKEGQNRASKSKRRQIANTRWRVSRNGCVSDSLRLLQPLDSAYQWSLVCLIPPVLHRASPVNLPALEGSQPSTPLNKLMDEPLHRIPVPPSGTSNGKPRTPPGRRSDDRYCSQEGVRFRAIPARSPSLVLFPKTNSFCLSVFVSLFLSGRTTLPPAHDPPQRCTATRTCFPPGEAGALQELRNRQNSGYFHVRANKHSWGQRMGADMGNFHLQVIRTSTVSVLQHYMRFCFAVP